MRFVHELPHDALGRSSELAAQLCADGGAAAAARAEAVLAAHQPVPQWAVEGVLLSSDLVPHVLAPLESEDGAAAAACSAWAAGWRATAEGRRRLKQVPFRFPEELLDRWGMRLAVIPGDEERLVVSKFQQTRVLDRTMTTVDELGPGFGSVYAANEQSLFTAGGGLRRLLHDGTAMAAYEEEEKDVAYPVLVPGGLLFCVAGVDDYEQDEIVALDAQTLEFRYRFGLSLLKCAASMAVVGEELFVCDIENDRLQVFSFAGEHRRSITGEWKKPELLFLINDRLYLVEEDFANDDEREEGYQLCGKRIFVLSLQGDTLQIFTLPNEEHGSLLVQGLCCFDDKLLASCCIRSSGGISHAVLAFTGL